MHIHEFQEMMRRLYFKRDFERGVNGTYNWLVDEVEELGEELKKGTNIEATEKETIISALLEAHGNISRAATSLGIYRQQLQRKIKQYNIAT